MRGAWGFKDEGVGVQGPSPFGSSRGLGFRDYNNPGSRIPNDYLPDADFTQRSQYPLIKEYIP